MVFYMTYLVIVIYKYNERIMALNFAFIKLCITHDKIIIMMASIIICSGTSLAPAVDPEKLEQTEKDFQLLKEYPVCESGRKTNTDCKKHLLETGYTQVPGASSGRPSSSISEGFSTSRSPFDSISKTPISFVEPNRFFPERRIR